MMAGEAAGATPEELREMVATDHIVKIHLASCIVHLLERARMDHAGNPTDLLAAQACLVHPSVQSYLSSMPEEMFPLPRDGKLPFDFPGT